MRTVKVKTEIDLGQSPVVIHPGHYVQVHLDGWRGSGVMVHLLVTPDGKFKVMYPGDVEKIDIKEFDEILFPPEDK